ncbi:hypothetical protein Pyn_17050 [Prunus yedoensis var. nudiflora]|uniref:Gibberellin 2-beta-dioxygenase 8 n=1 Tax=Prunus yedoensis var. nudiflora TaxID=2094558 RepID=A0A314ZFB5_PRUYE|nr:hypothetical protein Pyn_17050 [Prunus yedoensis var. nudiflora]
MDFEPPFQGTCKTLLQNATHYHDKLSDVDECELPVIDLNNLNFGHTEREKCVSEVAQAARQWGFFQVVNHGVSQEVVNNMQYEQKRLFRQPFPKKVENNLLNLSANSYRWGNPEATCLKQFSWSEAFHISTTEIPTMRTEHKSLRSTIEAFVKNVSDLAKSLAEILAQPLESNPFISKRTVRQEQDQVGGLEIYKDGRWLGVKPNPEALIVNIGDFFEALSNGIYKSIKHRVVTSQKVERFSVAYFYCPSYDAVIKSCGKPALYRQFTLREYKQQTQIDVREIGEKVGLSRFLL